MKKEYILLALGISLMAISAFAVAGNIGFQPENSHKLDTASSLKNNAYFQNAYKSVKVKKQFRKTES